MTYIVTFYPSITQAKPQASTSKINTYQHRTDEPIQEHDAHTVDLQLNRHIHVTNVRVLFEIVHY